MMATVRVVTDHGYSGADVKFMALGVTVIVGLLMVSRVRYTSFKSLPLAERVPFVAVLLALGIFVALAVDPPHVLLGIAGLYLLSGPAMWGWNRLRRRSRTPPAAT